MDLNLMAQAVALLGFLLKSSIIAAICLPYAILRCLTPSKTASDPAQDSCVFYEGTVYHVRRKPLHNSFRSGMA